jgi:hypothetical protein
MDDLNSIETQIRERLAAAEARRAQSEEALSRTMSERDRRLNRFKAVAKHLLDKVVFPRLQMLERLFPNAHVTSGGSPNTRLCTCRFDHTPDFPGSTTLEFSLSADDEINSIVVGYKLEILPIFFRFDPTDRLVISLDAMHEQSLASWLDAKLLQFTDTYLKLGDVQQYQEENMTALPFLNVIPAEFRLDAAGHGVEVAYTAAGRANHAVHVQHQSLPEALGMFQPIASPRDHAGLGVQSLYRSARFAMVEVSQDTVPPTIE